jgi:hypothetical protein
MSKRSSDSEEPLIKRTQDAATGVLQLPMDVFEHMAQFFDPQTFGRVAQTCKRVHDRLNGQAEERILDSMTRVVRLDGVHSRAVFRGGMQHGTEYKERQCGAGNHETTLIWHKGRTIHKKKLQACADLVTDGGYLRVGDRDLPHGLWYIVYRGKPYHTIMYDSGSIVKHVWHKMSSSA